MKFEQLEQLIIIDREKSISKAARALFMGQSTLSGSLHSLEEELGVCLFERTASGVQATPECKEILPLAKDILENRDRILKSGSKTRDLYGTITVHIVPAYSFLYSDILMRFQKQFPKASLNLEISTPEKIRESRQKENDIIAMAMMSEDERAVLEKDLNVAYESFFSHKVMLFVGAKHPLFMQQQVSRDDISQEKFITYSPMVWATLAKELSLQQEPLTVQDRDSLKRMISDGAAIAFLPETFARKDLYFEHGLIHPIAIASDDELLKPHTDYLIYPSKRQLTMLEKATLQLLREVLQDMNHYEEELKKEERTAELL